MEKRSINIGRVGRRDEALEELTVAVANYSAKLASKLAPPAPPLGGHRPTPMIMSTLSPVCLTNSDVVE